MATISAQATKNETAPQAQDEDGAEKPATNKLQSTKSKGMTASGEKKTGEASEKESSAKKSPAGKAKATGKGAEAITKKTATKKTDTKTAEGENGLEEAKGEDGQKDSKKSSTEKPESEKAVPRKFGTKTSTKKAAPKESSASRSETDKEAAGQGVADEQASESKVVAKSARKSKKTFSRKRSLTRRTEGGHAEGETGITQSGGVDSDVDMDDLDRDFDELDNSMNAGEIGADTDSDEEGEDSNDKDRTERPRGRNLTEDATPASKDAFTMKDSDESDKPAVHVHVAGATADPVKDYLEQTDKVPLLNAEEEMELARHAEAGLYAQHILESGPLDKAKDRIYVRGLKLISHDEQQAKNHLLEVNFHLMVPLAKRYMGRSMLFLDFIQGGNLGLIRAVERFNFTEGFRSSAYVTQRIWQAITCVMADQVRTIRIPVHIVGVINRPARVQHQTLQDLGRKPTTIEFVRELDMTEEKVIEIQKYGREPISLHTPLGEDRDSGFGDLIKDSGAVVPADAVGFTLLREQLYQVLNMLLEREADAATMRFGLTDGQTKTFDEVGKVYDITREHIQQMESKAMSKLRHPPRSQILCDYLD